MIPVENLTTFLKDDFYTDTLQDGCNCSVVACVDLEKYCYLLPLLPLGKVEYLSSTFLGLYYELEREQDPSMYQSMHDGDM